MRDYTAYIFDLDGTLLDTLPDLVVLTNKVLEQAGFPPCTQSEIQSFVGDGLEMLMRRSVASGVADRTEEEVPVDQLMDGWRTLYPQYGSALTKPYPHIRELLDILQSEHKRLAVLSNKFDAGTQEAINSFFPGVFSVIHGEGSGVPRKPNPAGLLRTMEELDVLPIETVYIGDSPTDVLVSERAGVDAIAVSWGYHARTELEERGIAPIVDDALEIVATHS